MAAIQNQCVSAPCIVYLHIYETKFLKYRIFMLIWTLLYEV